MARERFKYAGETVKINPGVKGPHGADFGGLEYTIEDYWQNVYGTSWKFSNGNPAALQYALRIADDIPLDDEVVYGKIGCLGYLMHVSELDLPE